VSEGAPKARRPTKKILAEQHNAGFRRLPLFQKKIIPIELFQLILE
jgi:hypothetical protein